MSTSEHDLIFHLLDLQSRDMRIENEEEDTRECVYESNSDDSDDELGYKKKKKKNGVFNQRREFVVHMFGATESGQPLRIDVTGFRPTMYLKLPFEQTNKAIDSIRNYLIQSDIPLEQLNLKKITRKVFYGFTANTYYPFLQIDVPSLTLFRRMKNLFLDEKCNPITTMPLDGVLRGKQVEVYEANIDPMLRFIHTQNIQPCGWVCIKNGKHMVQNIKDKEWTLECSYE
jgi:DNA polymerase elongation subunit (family B)